jgi:hypothetical protein
MIASVVKVMRTCGQGLDLIGRHLEFVPYVDRCTSNYSDKLHVMSSWEICIATPSYFILILFLIVVQPSIKLIKLGTKSPSVKSAFVAESASVIGNVQIGSSSSVWYSAIIRGETKRINDLKCSLLAHHC